VIPLKIWRAVGERVWAEVVKKEGDVLRDEERRLLCRPLQTVRRCVARTSVQGAVARESRLRERFHH
jgi:hypothetical protein